MSNGALCATITHAAYAADIRLRYGQNAAGVMGLSSLPFSVAQRKGFFPREGLDVVMVPIRPHS